MHLKDYYGILGIEPSATIQEIKKAYRRLALLYHPDKNNNDPYAAAQFTEAKEAYEVLTNPVKKEYYLQQRWYNQSIGKKKTQQVVTPVNILKESLELERYVATLDVHRMDKEGLLEFILSLLNDTVTQKLNEFKEQEVNDNIIRTTLKSVRVLKSGQAIRASVPLYQLANVRSKALIDDTLREMKRREKWENKELLIVILVTIAICMVIWLSL